MKQRLTQLCQYAPAARIRRLHMGKPHIIPIGEQHLEIAEYHDRFDVGSYPSASAYAMTKYVSVNRSEVLGAAIKGKTPRVLEIGSGTGAVGLACAAHGADVVLTDREALLEQIQTNIKLNQTCIDSYHGSARALPLDWKNDEHLRLLRPLAVPPFDLLIGSDLIYPATSAIYNKLLNVLLVLPAKRVLFAYPHKRDRAPQKFFDQAVSKAFRIQELERDEERVVAIVELFPPRS